MARLLYEDIKQWRELGMDGAEIVRRGLPRISTDEIRQLLEKYQPFIVHRAVVVSKSPAEEAERLTQVDGEVTEHIATELERPEIRRKIAARAILHPTNPFAEAQRLIRNYKYDTSNGRGPRAFFDGGAVYAGGNLFDGTAALKAEVLASQAPDNEPLTLVEPANNHDSFESDLSDRSHPSDLKHEALQTAENRQWPRAYEALRVKGGALNFSVEEVEAALRRYADTEEGARLLEILPEYRGREDYAALAYASLAALKAGEDPAADLALPREKDTLRQSPVRPLLTGTRPVASFRSLPVWVR
jgi:hypothetical protein